MMNFLTFIPILCYPSGSLDIREIWIVEALEDARTVLEEMQASGFPGTFVGDAIINAERVFMQANYAEILRDESIPFNDPNKTEARNALQLVNWEDISYGDVIPYLEEIKNRKVLVPLSYI